MKLLEWFVFEITSINDLQGVKFRGTLRKFAIARKFNLIIENDEINEKCVRFGILEQSSFSEESAITKFVLKNIDKDAEIKSIGKMENPVLSKLEVNDESRYSI